MSNVTTILFALGMVIIAGVWDYPAAVATAANAGQYPDLPRALYCPKHDARHMALRHEIAHQADGKHWGISCLYVEVK